MTYLLFLYSNYCIAMDIDGHLNKLSTYTVTFVYNYDRQFNRDTIRLIFNHTIKGE